MSRASDIMKTVEPTTWPFGYLFVDSEFPRAQGRQSYVDRLELHIYYSDIANATIFCHVIDISRRKRTYTIIIFEDEPCEKAVLMVEASFIDVASTMTSFDITVFSSNFSSIAQHIARALHPLVYQYLIDGTAPISKDGTAIKLWYVGFTSETVVGIEHQAQCSLRSLVVGLRNRLSQ